MAEAQEAQTEDEPTMEEILASIRRIISEDDEPGAEGGEAGEAEANADAEAGDDDAAPSLEVVGEESAELPSEEPLDQDGVLELTDALPDDGDMSFDEAGDDETTADDAADFADLELVDPEPVAEAPAEPVAVASAAPVAGNPGIVSAPVADATAGAFSSLLNNILVSSRNSQGMTLDDVVRELLRPMLREWLDTNLEGIVKAQVADEIDRITARARR